MGSIDDVHDETQVRKLVYIHVCTYTHTHTHTHTHMCMYVYTCVCVYVCVHNVMYVMYQIHQQASRG